MKKKFLKNLLFSIIFFSLFSASVAYGAQALFPNRGGTGTTTIFSAGSLVFSGANGIYKQDNSNLFWDDSNDRLGIGTATPSNLLDVYSATNSSSSLVVGESLNFTANLNASTTRHAMFTLSRIGTPGTPLTYIGAGTGATATSTIFASNNDNLLLGYDTSGTFNETMRLTTDKRVGIGTTGPDRVLDVLSASAPQLRLTYTDGSVYSDLQTNSAGQLVIAPTGSLIYSTASIRPSADNTYSFGDVQNYEWASVAARDISGNNRRFRLNLSTNTVVLQDHPSVGTGVQIMHRGTAVAQFGDGSGNSLMYLNYTPGSVRTSLATTSAGYFQVLPSGGKTLLGANKTLTSNAGWYYLNAGTSGSIQITTSGVSQSSPVGFISAELTYTSPSGESFSNARGINFIANMRSTSTGNSYFAGNFSARTGGSGQASIARGIAGEFIANNSSGTPTITTGIGVEAFAGNNYASATVTNGYALKVRDLTNAGTFTNYYGLHIGDITTGTQTNTPYSIYTSDTNAINHFKGLTQITGGLELAITTVNSATYDLTGLDTIVHVTYTTTGAVTSLTLPTAQTNAGRTIIIKDAGGNAGTNNITIDTEGSETIDGDGTEDITGDYDWRILYSDGSNWFIIG